MAGAIAELRRSDDDLMPRRGEALTRSGYLTAALSHERLT